MNYPFQYMAELSLIDSDSVVPDVTIVSTNLVEFQQLVEQSKNELLQQGKAVVIMDNDGQCFVPHIYYNVTNKYKYGQQ